MPTLTPTPQVILSFNLATAGAFSLHKAARKAEDRSMSKFLTKGIEDAAFVFASNEQGNLLKFRTSWGKGQSDQSTFQLEILDPGGRFEDSFFGIFAKGAPFNDMYADFLVSQDVNLQRSAGRSVAEKRSGLYSASVGEIDQSVDDAIANGKFTRTYTLYERRQTRREIRGEWEEEGSAETYAVKGTKPIVVQGGSTTGQPADYNGGAEWYMENSTGRNGGAEEISENFTNYTYSHSGEITGSYKDSRRRTVWREYYRQWVVSTSDDVKKEIDDYRRQMHAEFRASIQLEEDLTPYKEKADKIKALGHAPFTKPFWITFGVGDDAGTYAPAQYVKLVNIDYGLSTKKVRTLTLHFVPSAGILGLEADPQLLEVLTGTDQIEYQAETNLFGPHMHPSDNVAKSPITAIPQLIKNAYAKALGTDIQVEYLTYELESFIRKKFAEHAISIYHQMFTAPANPKVGKWKTVVVNGQEILRKVLVDRELEGTLTNLTNYLVETTPGDSELLASTGNAPYLFLPNDQRADAVRGLEDINMNGQTDTMARFYTRVCKSFYKELGIEYRCWFTDSKGNKIQYFPFDRKLEETNSASMRKFIHDQRHLMGAKITLKASKGTPNSLAADAKTILAKLSPNNRPPILLNYPEEAFLTEWHRRNNSKVSKTTNVMFIVTAALYSALVKGHGDRYISNLKTGANLKKIQTFVNTYGAYFKASPSIGKVEGLHDPYSYLSAKSRFLGADKLLVTDDSHGKIDSARKLENHLRENKIPLFVYGYKNSNILDFKFDLDMWYAQFLRLIPESVRNCVLSCAIKDPKDPKGLFPLALALDLIKSDKSGESLEAFLDKMWEEAEAELVAADGGLPRDLSQENFGQDTYSVYYGEDSATNAARTLLNTADFTVGRQGQDLRAQQSYFEAANAEEGDALRASVLPSRKEFKARIKKLLLLIMNEEAYSPKIKIQSSEDSNMLGIMNSIQDRLQSQGGFKGTITTLPLFQIMSPTMIGRSSVLYMVESQIYSNEKLDNTIPYKTWLSGEYWILGYEGVIENNKVTTSFDIVKKPYLRNVTIEE